jgi:large subunit ribosomal protein L9
MQVVFTKDLPGTARRGEVKEFNDGYARNFLVAKGFAVQATPQMLQKIKNESQQQEAKMRKEQEHAQKLKAEMDKRMFTIAVKVGKNDHIFGSVNEKDVLARIKEKMNMELEKSQISIPKHIKELGEYEIEIKLTSGITAKPKIKLVNQDLK